MAQYCGGGGYGCPVPGYGGPPAVPLGYGGQMNSGPGYGGHGPQFSSGPPPPEPLGPGSCGHRGYGCPPMPGPGYSASSGYGGPACQSGYGGPPGPGPGYGGMPAGGSGYGAPGFGASGCYGGLMPPAEACDVFVEVSPEVQPNFDKADGGRFVMDVPPIMVRLSTSCTPALPLEPGLSPFKPFEEFMVTLPNVQRVIFDGTTGMPISGSGMSQTTKRGAVLEVLPRVTLNAQIKTNSPYGSLVLEDFMVTNGYKQKIGETALNYRLEVQGQLSVNKGGGNRGANRLEVDLSFSFTCSLGRGPAAEMGGQQCYGPGPGLGPYGSYGEPLPPSGYYGGMPRP